MANKCDVAKRVARLKLQLTDTAESATVLKILHKLKDLDITLDILAETGIGKTVNSLRRHEQVGEFAKSLVRGWKRLIPKHSTSQTEDGGLLEGVSVEDKPDYRDCPSNGIFTVGDSNNNLTKTQNSLDDEHFKTSDRNEKIRHRHHSESLEKCRKENNQVSQNVMKLKSVIQGDKNHNSSLVAIEKKSDQSNRKAEDGDVLLRSRSSADIDQKSRSDCKANAKSSTDRGKLGSIKESNKKSKTSKSSKESTESLSFEPCEKYSKTLKLANVTDDRSSGQPKSSEAPNKKRKKISEEKQLVLKLTQKSESGGYSKQKNKRAKTKHEDKQRDSDKEEPSMSFESYLNYDENILKRRERSGVKKPKRTMRAVKEMTSMQTFSSTLPAAASAQQDSVMDLINIPLPADLLQCERPSSVDYFEKKVEREPDFCDLSEEPAVFPGQRLNKKMQVYSGAKTVFLPTMMSLHQQCIRTLQNNINLLYETGGVPFEILEPVLERCTPEQLLRIEEYNPIYIGVTDRLWGKHCQREFKDSRLLEYESWKEMYIRLSEEREIKLQRLTKSIVSAHSNKPKGRQVKMAFIHTVAKPPRDVRIQQEIHGTAAQQPPQLRCSAKVPNSRMRPSCPEPSRSNSTPQAASGNTQDPRKKSRVAPMMAKSLKAFKKQLGRR